MAASDVVIRVVGDSKQFDKTMGDVEKRADSLSDKMGSAGKKLSIGLTLPIVGAGIAAFNMASDVDESLSQVGTVFGDEAAGVIAASESMADAFSQAEFLAFAGNIGDIAQGLGFAREDSDDLAIGILDLGQDLASFKNIEADVAINAITSALTGERDSLKSMGIVINQAQVDQKAFELGLWDGEEALTAQMKAQATLALITEASANSIGDFARTSDGAANASRIASANFKDMAAGLGQQLLPIGTKIIKFAGDLILKFQNLNPNVKKFIVPLLGIVAAIGPLLLVGAKMITMWKKVKDAYVVLKLAMLANPFTAIAIAVAALVVLIVLNWDTIKEATTKVWEWIRDKFDAVVSFFAGLPARISAMTGGMFKGIANAFVAMINFLIGAWNDLSFTFPSITLPSFLGGKTVGGMVWDTPNIPLVPSFHQGGVFNSGRGQGLALLQDGETVLPRGAAGGIHITVNGFVGSESRLAAELDRILTRRLRRGALGFVA